METLIFVVIGNVFLLALMLILQSVVRGIKVGFKYALSNFDEIKEEGVFAARLARAKNNQLESLILLVSTALIASTINFTHSHLAKAAWIFLFARLVYIPITLAGVPILRTATFMIGLIAWGYTSWLILLTLI